MKFGLLGEKLGHSYSKIIHHQLGNKAYELYEQGPDDVADFLADQHLKGINVTIPYKKEVMPFCQEISPQAERIGCVNTMVRRDGKWWGHNTDYDGFLYLLRRNHVPITGHCFLILGDGATSGTVRAVLEDFEAKKIIQLSRKKAPFYADVAQFHEEVDYIINTTSVGMYPNVGKTLISLEGFRHLKGVFDVIYNPHRTQLLLEAEERHLITSDGLPMLVAQGVYAAEFFMNKKFPNTVIEELINQIRKEQENIILVGMPGVGKTTVGKRLAQDMKREFIDTDALVIERVGDIPTYIETVGEKKFREEEAQVIAEVGCRTGLVIATGGGAVLRKQNYYNLRQNGRIYQLDRPLAALSTKNRPFSQGGIEGLKALYREREPFYRFFRQVLIRHSTASKTAALIREDFDAHFSH